MAVKRMPFRQKFSTQYQSGGVNRLSFPAGHEVRKGERYHITRFYVANETSDGSDVVCWVETPGGRITIDAYQNCLKETGYVDDYELVLTPGQRLVCEWTGGTGGDIIELVCSGYMINDEV